MEKRKTGLGWLAVSAAVSAACLCASCASAPSQASSPSVVSTKAEAAAPGLLFETITVEQVKKIMEGEGYSVSVDKEGVLHWKIDGYNAVMFVDKDGGRWLQFYAAFEGGSATMEKVNAWNQTKRYSRSYLDDKKCPCLELDLDLDGGVSRDRVVDFLKTCRVSFNCWCQEVVE